MKLVVALGCCVLLGACVASSPRLDRQFGTASAAAMETQRLSSPISSGSGEPALPEARVLLEQHAAQRAAPAAPAPRAEGVASAR